MTETTSDQEVKRWKQQYYDHLDLLERKEKDWQQTESILKKTVLRLSIAAEGQHASVDRHLQDIRSVVKKQVNAVRLETILEDISALMLKIADKQVAADKKVITAMIKLLENIHFSGSSIKQKNRLIKKLSKSSDDESEAMIEEMRDLISASIDQKPDDVRSQQVESKPGFFEKVFGSKKNNKDKLADEAKSSIASSFTESVTQTENVNPVSRNIPQSEETTSSILSQRLIDAENEPSTREVLLRLLEQLMEQPDLRDEVDALKRRLKDESSDASWQRLLKDVAQLIINIRKRMQSEKQEFETFLQQITGRLTEMDEFLEIETASINDAEQAGSAFDVVVNAQVQDIQHDMNAAANLNDLKDKVEKRLTVVSDHIKQYRMDEQLRYSNAQQNVEDMQSRLRMLEEESGDLRKLMLEKNREAMFDALTEIPNRLSYEKKSEEEIARCKRFNSPLCMAVWDVDLFKQVNDTYGHSAGDKVLKAIAQLLKDRIRETDFIARYGGEEFVMFMPGIDEDEALKMVDVLREKVFSSKFKHNGEVVKISVSCGISSFVENDTHQSMFERADKALYTAKDNGRNQCVVA